LRRSSGFTPRPISCVPVVDLKSSSSSSNRSSAPEYVHERRGESLFYSIVGSTGTTWRLLLRAIIMISTLSLPINVIARRRNVPEISDSAMLASRKTNRKSDKYAILRICCGMCQRSSSEVGDESRARLSRRN